MLADVSTSTAMVGRGGAERSQDNAGCSTMTAKTHADNLRTTVVRGDKEFHPMPGNPEAYERKFNVDDIHLLKAGEAESLRDSAAAQQWFGDIYEDPVVRKIQRAIKSLLRR